MFRILYLQAYKSKPISDKKILEYIYKTVIIKTVSWQYYSKQINSTKNKVGIRLNSSLCDQKNSSPKPNNHWDTNQLH